MELPQNWHKLARGEEVVKFLAELMEFSVVQVDQSYISYLFSKVTSRHSASSQSF